MPFAGNVVRLCRRCCCCFAHTAEWERASERDGGGEFCAAHMAEKLAKSRDLFCFVRARLSLGRPASPAPAHSFLFATSLFVALILFPHIHASHRHAIIKPKHTTLPVLSSARPTRNGMRPLLER